MKGIGCDHHVWNNAKDYSVLFIRCQDQNGQEIPSRKVEARAEARMGNDIAENEN